VKLSVVIPVYNAENTIADLVNEVNVQLSGIQHEIILVNDGSKDKTSQICEKIAAENATVNYIELKKNFGEHNAVMCGLNFAKGEYTAIIDFKIVS
jgi:undecaprenyl-phosphate 4-deoxy-4-formamido-L-arabinose transferase